MSDTNRCSVRPLLRASLFCAASLLALSPAAFAQQQQQPTPQQSEEVVKIESTLMQAGVTVLDKQGHFVGGLKSDQFELLVDGKPQSISFFEQVAAGSPEERAKLALAGDARARAASRPGDEPQARGRAVIFFLDDLHMSIEGVTRARKLIQHFVDREMGEDDLAAVASASGQLGFLQQLTGNREVLRTAASRLKPWPQAGTDGQLPIMSEYIARAIDVDNDRDLAETYIQVLVRDGMKRPMAEAMVRTRARTILLRANADTRNTLRSLNSMVRAVAPMPGRKLAFFLSDGFLLTRTDTDVADALRDITDAAVRTGMVLYTLDTRGLATDHWLDVGAGSPPPDGGANIARVEVGAMSASQEALHLIAEQTGGRAILNTNAQTAALSRTVNETSAYYLIAWRPNAAEQHAGKFRKLEVSVKGRPDLVVLVQRGFVEGAPAPTLRRAGGQAKPSKPGDELNVALAAAVPARDVPANLELGYAVADNGEPVVTALVSVPVDSLGTDAAGKAAVEVAGYVVNLEGKIGSRFAERLSMTVAQTAPGPDGRGYVLYRHQIKVTPGLYQVRAATLDVNSGRAGSAAEWIEVPDLKSRKFTLGSLTVGERPADTSQPYNAENFVAQRSAERRFKRDTPLRFMTYIYNAQGAPPDLEAQIQVLRAGAPVLTFDKLKVDPGADIAHGIAYGAEIPLDALAPGRYVLQLTVTNRAAQANASGRTLFIVE
ncbi:MAG TPA: VWA domain-containing protein [Pyrinomonadaceae bacterium]|jgi:VWFA-related protein|nr:VWA domain-containing protein [Pyrinomonadaceae bacterium]